MNQELLNRLLAPIPGDHPCGEDLSFSMEFDAIREARREEDASLAQGEWEKELKSAQWPQVKQQCEQLLSERTKDLQLACWYVESLAKLEGFDGLQLGLNVIEVLLTDFWEFFYPALDPDDMEERAAKLEWLNRQLAATVRDIPLTTKTAGAYSWLKWNESRQVENLGLKDADAKAQAIADGKLSGEVFDKAAISSGLVFYQELAGSIAAVRHMLAGLEKHADERFGRDAPSLKDLQQAVADCAEVVNKLVTKLGGNIATPSSDIAMPSAQEGDKQPNTPDGSRVPVITPVVVGQIRSRPEAVAMLRQVAQFFKHNEPHSPVSLLAERAAKWAEMPLEQWLSSVIKDEATLGQLRELLDVRS